MVLVYFEYYKALHFVKHRGSNLTVTSYAMLSNSANILFMESVHALIICLYSSHVTSSCLPLDTCMEVGIMNIVAASDPPRTDILWLAAVCQSVDCALNNSRI